MGTLLPVRADTITSGYGDRGGSHGGIDYAAPTGTPVVSSQQGVVTFAGWDGTYGYRVAVRHPDGHTTYYAHLSAMNVSVGQQVGVGHRLGAVGSTGNSTGPHLHFEVRQPNGARMDPNAWLQGARVPDASGGYSFAPMTVTKTGVRVTPLANEEDFPEGEPNMVDITAHESRYGYVAPESRFEVVSSEQRFEQESRSGEEVPGSAPTIGGSQGEVEWQDTQVEGGAMPSGAPANSESGGRDWLYNLAKQAGFTDDQARIMAAIAMAESGGKANAFNGKGRDLSYGLWQINMLGGMGPERRQLFGINSNAALYDPLTNARAAKAIFDQQGYGAWSVWGNGYGSYRTYL